LAQRLLAGTQWVASQSEVAGLPIGLFGASTSAAAALIAAARAPASITAVVSRGGRPDLAGDDLSRVSAPTLLLVGSRDEHVLGLNRQALTRLTCPKRLVVIPGASHLFEEAGTLETASRWAAEWFVQYLVMEQLWRGRAP
jgi:pimeloyl-ACP methyl ester carboxylesterase